MSLILGIETSCDETAASVVENGRVVRSNIIASQHDLHRPYGGVVPEIASRAHLERINPVIDEALAQAGVSLAQVDAVAVGNRPGLIGSLLVGVSAAKALAWATGKPLVGVDHVEAHLYAPWLIEAEPSESAPPDYPALGLVVSGGHTSLYRLRSPLELELLGRTIDDAVGEAYDKAATILGLGFPGGPRLDRRAALGDASAVEPLPRTLLGRESLDFSYSGLKTALLYRVRGLPQGRGKEAVFERSIEDLSEQQVSDLCAAFQQAAVTTLIRKIDRAIDQSTEAGQPPRSLLVGGGVSANSLLRSRLAELGKRRGIDVRVPAMGYCLDNAAMIAGLAHVRLEAGHADDMHLPALATASC